MNSSFISAPKRCEKVYKMAKKKSIVNLHGQCFYLDTQHTLVSQHSLQTIKFVLIILSVFLLFRYNQKNIFLGYHQLPELWDKFKENFTHHFFLSFCVCSVSLYYTVIYWGLSQKCGLVWALLRDEFIVRYIMCHISNIELLNKSLINVERERE